MFLDKVTGESQRLDAGNQRSGTPAAANVEDSEKTPSIPKLEDSRGKSCKNSKPRTPSVQPVNASAQPELEMKGSKSGISVDTPKREVGSLNNK